MEFLYKTKDFIVRLFSVILLIFRYGLLGFTKFKNQGGNVILSNFINFISNKIIKVIIIIAIMFVVGNVVIGYVMENDDKLIENYEQNK